MSSQQLSKDQADATVAICRCGGAVVMAVTVNMSAEMKTEFGEAAADGCEIRHMTVAEVRALKFGCACETQQANLF